ncbi:MAG: PH domain-containing protein [Saprospiraceae bacterium]|nr:PH domain-containing protein [Saprospiraceae bacterium]
MDQPNQIFTNPQVDLDSLPEADQMEMIPLESAYKMIRYISSAFTAFILITISWIVVWIQPGLNPYGYIAATVITLFSWLMIVYSGVSFSYMSYAIRERDISYKSGWLWKSMTTIPFNRVQHCDIKQGILDRRFGLSKLTIYTAGGQNTDLEIPGLLPDTAEKLKAFILRSTEQSIENE